MYSLCFGDDYLQLQTSIFLSLPLPAPSWSAARNKQVGLCSDVCWVWAVHQLCLTSGTSILVTGPAHTLVFLLLPHAINSEDSVSKFRRSVISFLCLLITVWGPAVSGKPASTVLFVAFCVAGLYSNNIHLCCAGKCFMQGLAGLAGTEYPEGNFVKYFQATSIKYRWDF